jgi:hypothetical protein
MTLLQEWRIALSSCLPNATAQWPAQPVRWSGLFGASGPEQQQYVSQMQAEPS